MTLGHGYGYLGLLFCPDVSWTSHVNDICNKARRLIGLLYRRFYKNSSSQTLIKLYCSFIRPRLEYASVVWSPYLIKDISTIEKVQKFALRMCLKDWSLGYDECLQPSLLYHLWKPGVNVPDLAIHNEVHNNIDFSIAPVVNRVPTRMTMQT